MRSPEIMQPREEEKEKSKKSKFLKRVKDTTLIGLAALGIGKAYQKAIEPETRHYVVGAGDKVVEAKQDSEQAEAIRLQRETYDLYQKWIKLENEATKKEQEELKGQPEGYSVLGPAGERSPEQVKLEEKIDANLEQLGISTASWRQSGLDVEKLIK